MALFSQNMLELAAEIAVHDRTYEDMIRSSPSTSTTSRPHEPSRPGRHVDEEDGFYYDLLRLPTQATR